MTSYTEIFTWGAQHRERPNLRSYNILISSVSCGRDHAGFISHSGHVYTMGSNADGRLGIGDTTVQWSASPCLVEALLNLKASQISCGGTHTAIVAQSGLLFTWGVGALGLGEKNSSIAPQKVKIDPVSAVSCGDRHTGVVCGQYFKMWGEGSEGQLGHGKRTDENIPVLVSLGGARAIACGESHTLFLTKDGCVYACGSNSGGQLGTANRRRSIVPTRVEILSRNVKQIACGSHSACISKQQELFVWGTGAFGECLVPTRISGLKASYVSIGHGFAAVVDYKNRVLTWGENQSGQLGQGDYQLRDSPSLVERVKSVKTLECGGNYVMALGADVRSETNLTGRTGQTSKQLIDELSRALAGSHHTKILDSLAMKYEKMQHCAQRERNRRIDLEKELKQLKQGHETQLKTVKAEVKSLHITNSNLKSDNETLETHLNKARSDSEQLKIQVSNLEAALLEAQQNKFENREVSLQQTFTTTLQERDNPCFLLDELDKQNKIFGVQEQDSYMQHEFFKPHRSMLIDRYPASPVESQFSVSPQGDYRRREDSEFFQLRTSKSAAELVCMMDSPAENQSRSSPNFMTNGNTPPTFREGGLTESVIFMQGHLKNSITDLRAKLRTIQENKEAHVFTRYQIIGLFLIIQSKTGNLIGNFYS